MTATAVSESAPWVMADVPSLRVEPVSKAISGRLAVPGSKSMTNRAVLLAGVARGMSVLHGYLRCDDSWWAVKALEALGLEVNVAENFLKIYGHDGRWAQEKAEIYLGQAGTLARFLPGLLAAGEGEYALTASAQLMGRPVAPLLNGLKALGSHIETLDQEERLPIRIYADGLQGGAVSLPGHISSQFVSGLLMAAPLARAPVTLTVEGEMVHGDYIDITVDMMQQFGVRVRQPEAGHYHVAPQRYQGGDIQIEADASTASYFFALAALTGGQITVTNLHLNTRQPDIHFLDVLRRLGCHVEATTAGITVRGPERLKGGQTFDMGIVGDATLTLMAMAPFADGPIEIRNVAHIRRHECDRISVPAQLLTQLGVKVEEYDDGLKIWPVDAPDALQSDAPIDTHEDHRIAMAFALVGAAGNGITLQHPACVSKTCPVFFELLSGLGVRCHS